MLVLSRTEGDTTVLRLTKDLPAGTEVVLHQLKVQGHKSRIGVEAPRELIHVLRGELIQPEQEAA